MRLRFAASQQFVLLDENEHNKRPTGEVIAENCLCIRRAIYRAQLAVIPPKFHNPRLRRLRPRTDLHPRQAVAINFIQEHPNDSYLLTGRNRAGKSHFGWALYRHGIAQKRPAVACALSDLLFEYRRVEIGVPEGETLKSPRVTAEDLRRDGKPWLLFIDEFEKARPSEFSSEQLFKLLDAATSFGHQLVITSNMKPDELRHHWSRIDEIWGNSIMTRLQVCNQVEFF